jgi:drug/metabolite transporter (DMT)-like permease
LGKGLTAKVYKGYRTNINMADVFSTIVQNMMRLGFFQFLFPFLLSLAIIYGLMRWALPKQLPKSATGVIALIISFFIMLYSSWNYAVVQFFANISGAFLIVGSGILFVVILLALTGIKVGEEGIFKGRWAKWIMVLVIVFIGAVIFFGAGGGMLVQVPPGVATTDFWTIIFFIIILAIVVFWLGAEGEKAEAAGAEAGKGT